MQIMLVRKEDIVKKGLAQAKTRVKAVVSIYCKLTGLTCRKPAGCVWLKANTPPVDQCATQKKNMVATQISEFVTFGIQ